MSFSRNFFVLILFFFTLSNTIGAQSRSSENLNELITRAKIAQNSNNAAKASKAYAQAVELCRSVNDTSQLKTLLVEYGRMLCYNGNYKQAIEVLIEAYECCGSQSSVDKARALMTLGIVNYFMGKADDALTYYQRAGQMAIELNNLQGASIAYNNSANIYQKRGDYTNAIESYNKSLEIQKTVKDSATLCNTYFNVATCYYDMGNTDQAEELFLQSYNIANAINDIEAKALCLVHRGDINVKKGFVDKGFSMMEQAEQVAQSGGYGQVLNEVFRLKSETYERTKQYDKALEAFQEFKEFSDSTINLKSIEMLNEFQVRYETLEKEHQIEMHQATINRQNTIRWALILGLVLCLIVIFLFFRINKLQKVRNKELNDKNTSNDKLFSIIAHDLKNPAIAQRNTLQNLVDLANQISPQMLKEQSEMLLSSAESQVELLQNLLSWARMELGRMPYNPIKFDLKSTIDETVKLLKISAEGKNIEIITNVASNTIAFADKNMTSTILRNLVTNALKFSYSGSKVKIDVVENPDFYSIAVVDSGVGISEEQLDGIFSVNVNESSTGTGGESGSRLGLVVCKEMAERNQGSISVSSKKGSGSTFTFTINKSEPVRQSKLIARRVKN